jgi:hypothetical protein
MRMGIYRGWEIRLRVELHAGRWELLGDGNCREGDANYLGDGKYDGMGIAWRAMGITGVGNTTEDRNFREGDGN